MFKEQMNRLSKRKDAHIYKDIPLRQYTCHKQGHMKFASHREMRRGATKGCSLSEQKK